MNSESSPLRTLIFLEIVGILFLAGCGASTQQSLNNQPPSQPPSNSSNPVPAIDSLTQNCAQAGGQAFILSVLGSNFISSSVVRWNGSDRPTTFNDSGQVSAQISAVDIATPGTAAVTVFNPAPGGGSSNIVMLAVPTGGVSPRSVVVDPTGKFAYVANEGCGGSSVGSVSMYTINPPTGSLQYIGAVKAGTAPVSMAVDPTGKFAYVTNFTSNDVSTYTINAATGVLTSTGTIGAGSGPSSIAIDPAGKFSYVANDSSKDISMYTVDTTTGMLTSRGTINSGSRAVSVTVHPSGKFAYAANGCFPKNLDTVSMYIVDTTTGALTSVGAIPTGAMGPSACSILIGTTVDPSGRFAYVASDGCGLDTYWSYVSTYTINPTTGALTSVGQTVVSDSCSRSVSVDPFSKFAYVPTNENNNVAMYTINATGALTFLGTVAAGSGPNSIAIHPSGKFAYVTNSGSNDVWMYSIDAATGALTLIGTIGT